MMLLPSLVHVLALKASGTYVTSGIKGHKIVVLLVALPTNEGLVHHHNRRAHPINVRRRIHS